MKRTHDWHKKLTDQSSLKITPQRGTCEPKMKATETPLIQTNIKKMSGMFFVVAMTEKTSYRGRIPVFLFFSGCVHPGKNFLT
jgi:hypothetical protein